MQERESRSIEEEWRLTPRCGLVYPRWMRLLEQLSIDNYSWACRSSVFEGL